MSWRRYTDFFKTSDVALRVAGRLGRGRGRLRVFDGLNIPPPPRLRPDLREWTKHELAAVWIGHATVLLRIDGKTILTDPVFSTRVGIGLGIATGGPRRHFAPALRIGDLPKLDLILISHAHFDHLDRPSLARLPKDVRVITSEHNSDLILDMGFKQVDELAWNQSLDIGGLKVTAREVAHWGARTFTDRHRGYAAFLLESAKHRVLYGADSAYQELFRDIGKVDLAILGIGAYDPYVRAHATPEQAWEMSRHVDAEYVLPFHHSTFRLSHEPMQEPITRMLAAAGEEVDRIIIREIGGQWAMPGRA